MNEFESGGDDFAATNAGAEPEAADAELDGLEAAFETVDAALKALDADDLDAAEALAASLGDTGDVVPADSPSSTEG